MSFIGFTSLYSGTESTQGHHGEVGGVGGKLGEWMGTTRCAAGGCSTTAEHNNTASASG